METELDTRKLDKLIKALGGKIPVAKVGVLGDSSHRKDGLSNAQIGAKHEFGQDGMPQRSFLRQPLIDNMQKYLDDSKAFTPEVLQKVITEATIVEWITKIGFVGVNIVLDAFATGGFGKWASWSNPKYKNNTGMILVDTQQLRDSIHSEVSK